MLVLIFATLISSAHGADQWCKLVRLSDGKQLTSFFGDCAKSQWGGEWGNAALVRQEPDPVKQAQYQAEENDRRNKAPSKAARISRLEAQCPNQTGVIKDLCAEILGKEF